MRYRYMVIYHDYEDGTPLEEVINHHAEWGELFDAFTWHHEDGTASTRLIFRRLEDGKFPALPQADGDPR